MNSSNSMRKTARIFSDRENSRPKMYTDISDIQTSTGKIISRGNKIDEIEVLDADEATPAAPKTDLLS